MLVKWSQYFLPTLRENPKDAEAVSHQLMVRAGLIRRLGAGAYTYLPFGLLALQKVSQIVREEMNRVGAQEILMPAMHPAELWKKTGRTETMGDVLFRFKDRTDKEVVLGPTHEEVVTDLLKEISSHKQLPVTVYQIQTKFRDEPRPRFGVIRSKEFLMKDAYSFHTDWASLDESYQAMYQAYERIFERCGMTVFPSEADSGAMGGDVSHEFMAPSEYGEGMVVRCVESGRCMTIEAAGCAPLKPASVDDSAAAYQEVDTPGQHTVEEVSRFLKVTPSQLIKTLIYDVDGEPKAVLVRGDHEVNEAKLAKLWKSGRITLASAATIRKVTGAPVGFAGPVGLDLPILADHAVMAMTSGVTGANKDQAHFTQVVPGRDFKPQQVADIRFPTPEDTSTFVEGGKLEFIKAIEAGHVFKLGTKYSETLGAQFQEPGGGNKPMIMGCYGIGINRIIATVIEQHSDASGIRWPLQTAPFQAVLLQLDQDDELNRVAGEVADLLQARGVDVLWDDRDMSPGAKFKDADLVGIPLQIVIGRTWLKQKELEVKRRGDEQKERLTLPSLASWLDKQLDTP